MVALVDAAPIHEISCLAVFLSPFCNCSMQFRFLISSWDERKNFVFCLPPRYLSGNQLIGVSAVKPYIKALLNGCRCVEREYRLLSCVSSSESMRSEMTLHAITNSGLLGWFRRSSGRLSWVYPHHETLLSRHSGPCHQTLRLFHFIISRNSLLGGNPTCRNQAHILT